MSNQNSSPNKGQKVFFKTSLALIDTLPGFFGKLKEFVGEFTIEGQDFTTYPQGELVFSFYTDKFNMGEGEDRMVDIWFTKIGQGWEFMTIQRKNAEVYEQPKAQVNGGGN